MSQPSQNWKMAAYLLGGLFVLVGLGAILLFLLTIFNDPSIRSVLEWTPASESAQPSLVLVFLERFGIVLPLLIFGLGSAFVFLGVQLRTQDIAAARWAHTALQWLAVGCIIVFILNTVNLLANSDPDVPLGGVQLLPVLAPLVLVIPFGFAYFWLTQNIERAFRGQEALGASETRFAWNLLVPTLTVFVLVAARPLEQTFIRSLTDKRFAGRQAPHFVGLENYRNLMSIRLDTVPCRFDEDSQGCVTRDDGSIRWESIDRDLLQQGYRTVWNIPLPFGEDTSRSLAISGLDDDFLQSVGTTLVFAVCSVTLELLIALFMAMTVNSDFAGRGFMRAVMLVPWAIPTAISARLWELMLKDTGAGIVNRLMMDLNFIDVPQAWLSDPSLQLPVAILVDVWKTAPFMALLLLAGLQTIPQDLYEAASVDGAGRMRQFFSITLPLLRPTIAVALVFRTLDALRVFDLFNVLFGRQQLSMATYDFETLVNNQLDGYASAISMVIFLLISIFAFIYVRLLNVETE